MNREPIDIEAGVQRIGDRELWQEIVADYLQLVEGLLAEISQSIRVGDSLKLRQDAHAVRGSSLELQVPDISALAAKLEDCGRDGRLEGSAELFDALLAEFARLNDYLRERCLV